MKKFSVLLTAVVLLFVAMSFRAVPAGEKILATKIRLDDNLPGGMHSGRISPAAMGTTPAATPFVAFALAESTYFALATAVAWTVNMLTGNSEQQSQTFIKNGNYKQIAHEIEMQKLDNRSK